MTAASGMRRALAAAVEECNGLSSALIRAPRLEEEPVRLPLAGRSAFVGRGHPAAESAAVGDEREALAGEAYARGVADGRTQVEAEVAGRIQEVARCLRAAVAGYEAERQRLATAAESTIRRLSVEIARHIMRCEVETGRPVAAALAREAIARLQGSSRITVRAHAADIESLREALAGAVDPASGVEMRVVATDAVERGGCVVDGGGMVVDARLLQQLRVVAEELGVGAAEPGAGAHADPAAGGEPGSAEQRAEGGGAPTAAGDGAGPAGSEESDDLES